MKQSGLTHLLFREAAAVTVAVHEGQYGDILSSPDHFKLLRRQSPLLSIHASSNKRFCTLSSDRTCRRFRQKRLRTFSHHPGSGSRRVVSLLGIPAILFRP